MLNSKGIQLIKDQLEKIEEIKDLNVTEEEFKKWQRKTEMILENLLTKDSRHYKDFTRLAFWATRMRMPGDIFPSSRDMGHFQNDLQEAKLILESILEENELFGIEKDESEKENITEIASKKIQSLNLKSLHPKIYKKCYSLYEKGEYVEAVEKSFKVVRDRLRDLTGQETGSRAFGSGRIHIKGAAAKNVDRDFNEAVKFLTMSIDFFRNEKSHTSDGKIKNPIRAYEYLRLSSLAMNLLENAEQKK